MSRPTTFEHLVQALREPGVARVDWAARSVSADGRVGPHDLTLSLDVSRRASTLKTRGYDMSGPIRFLAANPNVP
jgi:hypothetical protein